MNLKAHLNSILEMIPEIIAALMFQQCGSWLAYMLYSFNMSTRFYSDRSVWPQIATAVTSICTGSFLTFLRIVYDQIVFAHFFLMTLASIMFLLAGSLSIYASRKIFYSDLNRLQDYSMIFGSVGYGLMFVAVMTYVHVRANKYRAVRITLCHLVFVIGFVSTAHLAYVYQEKNDIYSEVPWTNAYLPIGYLLVHSSIVALVLLLLVFLLQGRLFNYKRSLDDKFHEEDLKRENFKTFLETPIVQWIVPKADIWNRTRLVFIMLLSKVQGGIFANNMMLVLSFVCQMELFGGATTAYGYFVHYFSLWGILFGVGMVAHLQLKWCLIFPLAGYASTLAFAVFFYSIRHQAIAGVIMWFFYLIIAIAFSVPDIGLLEVSSIKYYEFYYSFGRAFEVIPMIAGILVSDYPVTALSLWISVPIMLGIMALVALGMFLWYPNTLNKTIMDVQYMIMYKGKFDNGIP